MCISDEANRRRERGGGDGAGEESNVDGVWWVVQMGARGKEGGMKEEGIDGRKEAEKKKEIKTIKETKESSI